MRERITVVSADATTTTECVWAGQTLVAERVSETRAPGGRLQTTTTDYRYLYGPDSLPLELIVTPEGGTPVAYTFQCDGHGSVIALTDATGAAVATYAYDPWGAVLEAPEDGIGARNPLRYRGYYLDDATGLYYLPARYYDPATARFLSPDPAAPSAGDPLSLNRYAYCAGDPVNADDPTGAIMDSDGNGKLDSWDHNLAAEKASSTSLVKSYYHARANAEHAIAEGDLALAELHIDVMNTTGIGPDPRYSESKGWMFWKFGRGLVVNGIELGGVETITSAYPYVGASAGVSLGYAELRGVGYTRPGLYIQGQLLTGPEYSASWQWKPGESITKQTGESFVGALSIGPVWVMPSDYMRGWTMPDGTSWGYPW